MLGIRLPAAEGPLGCRPVRSLPSRTYAVTSTDRPNALIHSKMARSRSATTFPSSAVEKRSLAVFMTAAALLESLNRRSHAARKHWAEEPWKSIRGGSAAVRPLALGPVTAPRVRSCGGDRLSPGFAWIAVETRRDQ